LIAKIAILWTIGIILLVIGLILVVLLHGACRRRATTLPLSSPSRDRRSGPHAGRKGARPRPCSGRPARRRSPDQAPGSRLSSTAYE
jgi:hypothetical protein